MTSPPEKAPAKAASAETGPSRAAASDRTIVDGAAPRGDEWLPRAIAAMPRVDSVRGVEFASELLGGKATVHVGAPRMVDADEVLEQLGDCPVGVVLERNLPDGRAVRTVVEVEWFLAREVLARAVGSKDAGEIPGEPAPLADGERGILLFVAAQLLGGGEPSGWRALTVITTQRSWGAVLSRERCAAVPLVLNGGAFRGRARVLIPASAASDLAAAGGAVETAALLVGETQLSAEEVRGAAPGDTVLVDRWLARPTAAGLEGEGLLTFGESLTAWTGRFQGPRFVVGEHRLRASAPGDANRVRVDVQVRGLPPRAPEPGDTVVLAANAGHRLTLAVAGVPWAMGVPVEFEGEIGVRIETMLDAG